MSGYYISPADQITAVVTRGSQTVLGGTADGGSGGGNVTGSRTTYDNPPAGPVTYTLTETVNTQGLNPSAIQYYAQIIALVIQK